MTILVCPQCKGWQTSKSGKTCLKCGAEVTPAPVSSETDIKADAETSD